MFKFKSNCLSIIFSKDKMILLGLKLHFFLIVILKNLKKMFN